MSSLLVVAPLVLLSLTCVIMAVCLSLGEGLLPPQFGELHPYFGLVAVASYLGHLIQDRLLPGHPHKAEEEQTEEGGVEEGSEEEATAADAAVNKTPTEEGQGQDGDGAGKEDGEEKAKGSPNPAAAAKAAVKKSVPPSSSRTSPVRAKPTSAATTTTSQASSGGSAGDGNRLVNKLAGRCPVVINYGTMSHLNLGTPAEGGGALPARGTAGVPGLPGGPLQWDMRAGGEEGAASNFVGAVTGRPPHPLAGAVGGAGGAAGGVKKAGNKAAGTAKGAGKPSSRRKLSDFDRVLSHHASNCSSRRMAGQDLVAAIRKEEQSGDATSADLENGEEEDARDAAWIDQLEGAKKEDLVTSSRGLEPDFFRRQRGGSLSAVAVMPSPSPTSASGGGAQMKKQAVKALLEGKEAEEEQRPVEGEVEDVEASREEEGEAASTEGRGGGAVEGKAAETLVGKEGEDEKKAGEEEAKAIVLAGAEGGSKPVGRRGQMGEGGGEKEGEVKARTVVWRPKKAEEAGGKYRRVVVNGRRKMVVAAEEDDETEDEGEEEGEEQEEEETAVYRSDLDYLQDQFRLLTLVLRKNEVLVLTRERLLLGKSDTDTSNALDAVGGAAYVPHPSALAASQLGRRGKGPYGRAAGEDASGGADATASCRKKVEETEEELVEMNERIRARLVATFEDRKWIPRLEILAKTLHLRTFEKHVLVLLVREYLMSRYLGSASSGLGEQTDRVNFYRSLSPRCSTTRRFDIKTLCAYFSVTFTEQLQAANRYFSKESPLVRNGIITFTPGRSYDDLYLLSGSQATHVLDAIVRADEKLCDFLLGLDDTPASQVPVKGGLSVYVPTVSLDDVILPQKTRAMVVEALDGLRGYWELQQQAEAQSGRYERGATVFLLAGHHGTGKSTLADAIAAALGKRVLLVDDAADLANTSLQAKIHDAIVVVEDMKGLKDDDGGASALFSLMSAGRHGKSRVKDAIRELDTASNLFIFQTESLDSVPATIARRLALVVELQSPDISLRRQIWDALRPTHVELTDDVDLDELAMKWVLPGGRIKEAWTTAQVSAILRSGHDFKVMQDDLMKAAQRQLHGKLQLANLADKTTPLRGLDQAVLPPSVKKDLQTMIDYAKISGVLFGQWGFDVHHGTTRGMSALFYGPPGTGKTLAAEILAYELGKPIKKVNLAETVSMWVGETEKNLEALLKESKEADVVLFLDEAESLLRRRTEASANYETRWSNLLLQRIETYEGVLIAATNLQEIVDEAYQRRFKFWVEFTKPGSDDRAGIWRTLIPPQAPLSSDVDFKLLGQRYELTGGEIKSAVFRAAMRAASRGHSDHQRQEIAMKDLQDAAEEEEKKKNEGTKYPHMYS